MTISAIFTKSFGVNNAKNFERLTTSVFANTYLTIGRNYAWPNSDAVTAPLDTANGFYNFWNDMIGMKKITSADMNLVIPRVDWVANTVYAQYTQDAQLFNKSSDAAIQYTNSFYVRNNRDQVFKCLFNNFSANSTIMPEISVAGQLPENAFMTSSDGYKWKYMYSIPAGLKEKFFTNEFMPVTTDPVVLANAVDGRLDILSINVAGAGYNANNTSNSYSIFTVSGDGSGANITARVASTAANGSNVVGYNIIDGGTNYTTASLSIVDPLKISGTVNANVSIVIGPQGGHGSSVAEELGASNLMISIGIEGDENGVLPISTTQVNSFRQLALIKDPLQIDPLVSSNITYAKGTVYRTTYKYQVTQPSKPFMHDEVVYVGSSYDSASFTGIVQYYDSGSFYLYLVATKGSLTTPATVNGLSSGALATVLSVSAPEIKRYSGKLLYIENSSQIVRTLTETQQLKLTLRF